MREGIKITTGYQMRYMLFVQIMASGISFLLSTVVFWWFLDKNVWKELLSAALMLMNAGMIYSHARHFAIQDNKPYTPLKSNRVKGLMMGVVISAVTLIMFAVYNIVWHIWGTDGYLTNWGAVAYNMLFSLWTFPYFGIMGMSDGYIMWYSVVMFALIPPVFSWLGYTAGCKKFSLIETINKLSYEKKE